MAGAFPSVHVAPAGIEAAAVVNVLPFNSGVDVLRLADFQLCAVFLAGFGDGLPLHVVWSVSATACQWSDVINDIACAWPAPRASGGAGVLANELGFGFGVAYGVGVRARDADRRQNGCGYNLLKH